MNPRLSGGWNPPHSPLLSAAGSFTGRGGVETKIRNCIHQASVARQKALASGDSDQKTGWLLMAGMWDELAGEYKAVAVDYEGLDRIGSRRPAKRAVAALMTRAVDQAANERA